MKSKNIKLSIFFRFVLILSIISLSTRAHKSWLEITTVEDLCELYPEVADHIFNQLNLDYKGLESVKKSVVKGNRIEACNNLLAYFRTGDMANHLRRVQPAKTDKTIATADTILKDIFTIQNVKGKVPYGDDGHRDWYYKGPNNDKEWAWLSNRHSQIQHVLSAYFDTGNPKYASYIDQFLRDFIIKSMPYPAVKSSTSVWRGLEVSFRAKVWPVVFFGLMNSEYLTPATQLLILSSLPDHAHYNRNFHGRNNWLTMEISALATVSTLFPEYKNSEEWMDYSIKTMVESMKNQVYPDGVQTELTSHYHKVSLHNFELFKNICDRANKKLPDFFNETIEKMYSYLAYTMRPNGFRILNNDGDSGSDRETVFSGAGKYSRKDWEFIASNGKSGIRPSLSASRFFPWAGQLISRSGYNEDAHWSFFDVGPWGSGHQHNDKLHISISAFGKDLLVDAGRFAYTGEVAEKFRPYAKSSFAHNVILFDNKGQEDGPSLTDEPLDSSLFKITDDFDYASGTMDYFKDIDNNVEHTRSLLYVRGEFWIVVDRLMTSKPLKIDALWHWHPECHVEKEGKIVMTKNTRGNLAIIPLTQQTFDIEFVKGKEKPKLQGWYSPEYNKFEPNITSIYSTNIKKNSTIVWLLIPSEFHIPNIQAELQSVDNEKVKVKVKTENSTRQFIIPYFNNKFEVYDK